MANKPSSGFVVFGPQAGPLSTGDLDTNFNLLSAVQNDLLSYSNYLVDSSVTPNLITVASGVGITATYTAGLELQVRVATTNSSGTVNINLNGLGNVLVLDSDGTSVSIGSLVAGMIVPMIYDGAAFRLTGPQSTGVIGGTALFADGTVTFPSVSFQNSPGTGFYRVGANSIGLATAGVNRLTFAADGSATMTASATGVPLTINGSNTHHALILQAGLTLNQSFGQRIQGGTGTSDYALAVANAANTQGYLTVRGDGQTLLYELYNGINTLRAAATWDSGTFTGTGTGFSGAAPTGTFIWTRVGPIIQISSTTGLSGTSNSVNFGMTGLPASLWPTRNQRIGTQLYFDNGVTVDGSVLVDSGGGINFARSALGSWQAIGSKAVSGGFTMIYSLA